MRKNIFLILILVGLFVHINHSFAQGPRGRDFGFGIILGDPTGGTIKNWFNNENALTASIGGSYFGAPRIGADYLWHFDAFNSAIVKMYAGPGVVIGIGEGKGYWHKHDEDRFYFRGSGETGFAIRGIIGVNIIPRRTPIEIFFELGPLIGISPGFGTAFDVGLGIRFYP